MFERVVQLKFADGSPYAIPVYLGFGESLRQCGYVDSLFADPDRKEEVAESVAQDLHLSSVIGTQLVEIGLAAQKGTSSAVRRC